MKPGYVYLLRADGGKYKIGQSAKPLERMKSFTSLPFGITLIHWIYTDDMNQYEHALHEAFKEKRIAPEWFSLSQSDVDLIRGILSKIGGLVTRLDECEECGANGQQKNMPHDGERLRCLHCTGRFP